MRVDALIVGAGPVGLTMAGELARYGLATKIIDKNERRTDQSKAIVVWPRTLELIDRMGRSGPEDRYSDRFVQAGLKIESGALRTQSEVIGRLDLSSIKSSYKFGLMIPQSETERVLEEHLGTFGISVERQKELRSFAETSEGVVCTLKRSDGCEETVTASWLIGCDGAHSTVRHQLGKPFTGATLLKDWLLADVHLAGMAGPPSGEIYLHDQGVVAIFPLGGSRYRIIADQGDSTGSVGEGNRCSPSLSDVQRILDGRGPAGVTASDLIWLSSFTINERMVENYRSGRVFLAGDAAHVHSPAGGQGMNTGMQDAFNLAWKLAFVFHGSRSVELLLDSYSAERSGIARLLLDATGRATRLGLLRGRMWQAIRNRLASFLFRLTPVQHFLANIATEMAVGYSASPLNADVRPASGGPASGERAPIRRDEVPVGSGVIPRFTVYADARGVVPGLLEKYALFVEPAIRPPFAPRGIWLVRPDGYVALSAKEDNWKAVDAYLGRFK